MGVERRNFAGGPSRRQILAAMAACGASALLPGAALAQPAASHRIDLHHHFYPPEFEKAWEDWAEHNRDRVVPVQKNWTPARTLEEMDKNGVATSVLSLASIPGVWFDNTPATAIRMARLCNEYAAQMMRDHPGRFGLFAALPMLDVEASLKEIAYALDTLKADGIGLQTDYGDKWPGDPFYDPIFEELNRRKAVVYFHPTTPNCCVHIIPGTIDAMTEVPQDTNRCVERLLFSGTFVRNRDIRWLFSHAGGSIPMMAGRIAQLGKFLPNAAKVAPDGIETEMKRLNYEIANSFYEPNMAALTKFVPMRQIFFGTDFPYVTIGDTAAGLGKLGLSAEDLRAIERDNALALLPRLKV